MPTIAGGIIAGNEQRHIVECLRTLAWCDETIVLHSGDDTTLELARPIATRLAFRPFADYASQRQALLGLATAKWIFFVDADERITTELAAEIRQATERNDPGAPVGYWVPRRNYMWGRWIKGGGWFPDYQLRLFRRDRGRYDLERPVHELVILDGPVGHLTQPFVHFNYDSLGQFRAKQARYAELEARTLFDRGIRARPHNYLIQPLRELRRRFLTLGGYRDGLTGLMLATLMAYYTLVTYVTLRRLQRRN